MYYVDDEERFAGQMSFDIEDMNFDDLDILGGAECARCGTEFEAAEELEHIRTHGVCQSCLSELMLEAAEDAMGH